MEFYKEKTGVIVVLLCAALLAIWTARNSILNMFFTPETTPTRLWWITLLVERILGIHIR